jgi:hypothetical protein
MVITIFNTLTDRSAELQGRQIQLDRDKPYMNSTHYWKEKQLLSKLEEKLDNEIDEVLTDFVAFTW